MVAIDNIIFEITQECNLHCKYCYNIWKNDNEFKSNNTQTYKKTIKTIKRLLKVAPIKSITFTGGEPTLSDRFKEVVLFCRLQNINVSVITNGNILTKQEYQELLQMGISFFELTLLSHEPIIHDNLTQIRGSWLKANESIKEIISLNGNVIGVIVITKENYSQIEKTLELFTSLGVESVMLNRFNIGGEGIKHIKEICLTKLELNIAFSKANDYAENHKIQLSSNVCTPWCFVNPINYKNIQFVECSNLVSDKPITMDYKGNVRICNHSPIVLGNIFDSELKDILDNDYTKSWDTVIPELCVDCNVFDKCRGGCRGASEQLGLSLSDVDPILKYNI